jgi:hypothetical protein
MMHGEALLTAGRPELRPLIDHLAEQAQGRDDIRTERSAIACLAISMCRSSTVPLIRWFARSTSSPKAPSTSTLGTRFRGRVRSRTRPVKGVNRDESLLPKSRYPSNKWALWVPIELGWLWGPPVPDTATTLQVCQRCGHVL